MITLTDNLKLKVEIAGLNAHVAELEAENQRLWSAVSLHQAAQEVEVELRVPAAKPPRPAAILYIPTDTMAIKVHAFENNTDVSAFSVYLVRNGVMPHTVRRVASWTWHPSLQPKPKEQPE